VSGPGQAIEPRTPQKVMSKRERTGTTFSSALGGRGSGGAQMARR